MTAVARSDLVRLLKACLPLAADHGVRLWSAGGKLAAQATDLRMAVTVVAPAIGDHVDDWPPVVLSAEAVRLFLKDLRRGDEVALWPDPHALCVVTEDRRDAWPVQSDWPDSVSSPISTLLDWYSDEPEEYDHRTVLHLSNGTWRTLGKIYDALGSGPTYVRSRPGWGVLLETPTAVILAASTGHIDGPIRSAAWDYAAGKGL